MRRCITFLTATRTEKQKKHKILLNVDFEDNGNDEYGLVFSRDSEYDPLPSFQFNDRGEVFIGLPDDDVSEQVRDVLNRRYPVDSRRQLGEAVYDRLNLKRQVLESVIRADEKNGRDASEKKLELEFLEDVFESLDDII